jgi:hypothetical protein
MPGVNTQRALSIRRPWAYAILHLGKDVENRVMPIYYRGRILIQASLIVDRDGCRELDLDPDDRRKLPIGAIVGSVEVVCCTRNSESEWAHRGQWHWLLKNPRVVGKPLAFKGKLGIMIVPPCNPNARSPQLTKL